MPLADPSTLSPWFQISMDFDGITYDRERDGARLNAQLKRVVESMLDREWRTLEQIAEITGDPTQSISARLRDIYKPRFALNFGVEKEFVARGIWKYRLVSSVNHDRAS